MIRVIYKGVDVTDSVSVNSCIHEMWAAGCSDTLDVRFNDSAKLWDAWGVQVDDEIRIDYGSASTGTMFVRSAAPENGLFTIRAMSAPASAMARADKAWSQVRLLQLGEEIATRHGLGFKSYGVTDRLYPYLMQAGVSDFAFLHHRAMLEGCAFLVYDKTLILYDIATMEAETPLEAVEISLDGDYRYTDARARLFESCIVASGNYKGEYTANNGTGRVLRPDIDFAICSNDEAGRFAKGLLRDANSNGMTGYIRTNTIMGGYAAGSTISISNQRASSWDGAVFLYRVRHDYGAGTSKLFFRKPLEGFA